MILVTIRIDDFDPKKFQFADLPGVSFRKGGIYVDDPFQPDWSKVFSIIRENNLPLQEHGPLQFYFDFWPRSQTQLPDEWMGATLEYNDCCLLANCPSDYDPVPDIGDHPSVCNGRLRGDVLMYLRQIPRTPVVSTGVELIYKRSFVEFLGGSKVFDVVEGCIHRHQGRPLAEYVRATPKRKLDLFLDWPIEKHDYVSCSYAHFNSCGIWIGRKEVTLDVSVAAETTPLGHGGSERTVIFSKDQAESLRKRYRSYSSFELLPIFRENGPTARFAREIFDRFQELRRQMQGS